MFGQEARRACPKPYTTCSVTENTKAATKNTRQQKNTEVATLNTHSSNIKHRGGNNIHHRRGNVKHQATRNTKKATENTQPNMKRSEKAMPLEREPRYRAMADDLRWKEQQRLWLWDEVEALNERIRMQHEEFMQFRRQSRLSWLEAAFWRHKACSLMFDMAVVNVQTQFEEEFFAMMRLQAENSQIAIPESWFEDHSWTKGLAASIVQDYVRRSESVKMAAQEELAKLQEKEEKKESRKRRRE